MLYKCFIVLFALLGIAYSIRWIFNEFKRLVIEDYLKSPWHVKKCTCHSKNPYIHAKRDPTESDRIDENDYSLWYNTETQEHWIKEHPMCDWKKISK